MLSHHFSDGFLYLYAVFFFKLQNMSINRHWEAEYVSCWGATLNIWHAMQRGELQLSGGEGARGNKKIQVFRSSLLIRFNGIFEMEKSKS